MPSQSRKGLVQNFRLKFKISFFQDIFTIIEELTGDCPGVGLPEDFKIDKRYYALFGHLQKKYNLTYMFITDFDNVKKLHEWTDIKKVIDLYKEYWKGKKTYLLERKRWLENNIDLNNFITKIQKLTKYNWTLKELPVFLTWGYKDSGTYDRIINVIRIGIHNKHKEYLVYTVYHELIHYHIINHMGLALEEDEEEILCRAIFSLIFKNNSIAQRHWKESLNEKEIKKIKEKASQLYLSK